MSKAEYKRVYVSWPGGSKTGPHIGSRKDYKNDVEVWVFGKMVIIPWDWTEEVKPEIEPDRLYYYWSNDLNNNIKKSMAKLGKVLNREIAGGWDNLDHIEPVHRRWDELTEDEKSRIKRAIGMNPTNKSIFRVIYNIITGEEHP